MDSWTGLTPWPSVALLPPEGFAPAQKKESKNKGVEGVGGKATSAVKSGRIPHLNEFCGEFQNVVGDDQLCFLMRGPVNPGGGCREVRG